MVEKLINGLKDLGYSGPLLDKKNLDATLQEGTKNVEYTKLVNFLTNEIRTLLNIDEKVNPISSPEDAITFVMEVGSFLKELNCSYVALTQNHITDRLQKMHDKVLLLDYLATELMGARILQEKKLDKKIELKLQETDEAANMRKVLMNLRFPKPPANITIPQLFQKVCPIVQSTVQKVGQDLIGNSAFKGQLSDKQWAVLNGLQIDLNNDYKIRREMLLTRLDCTIQSFQWSDKTKGKDEVIEKIYTEKRKRLKTDPEIELADLLAAREDIAIIEKTSSSSVRKNTRSSLNKVIIGQVPDRGGRTSEQVPPPPEMPSWQQRSVGSSSRGKSRGGGDFSRGDYSNKQNQSGSYRGSYSNNQGGSYGSGYSRNQGESYGYNQGRSFDNSYAFGNYSSSSNYDRQSSYSGGRRSYGSDTAGGYYDNRNCDSFSSYEKRNSGSYSSDKSGYLDNRSCDRAGGYGKDNEQSSKRAKTYDSFQSNRSTYAEQYVKEELHNQQYHGKGNSASRGGGRSHYNRGGRSN